ncbi:substrate-binding domain-containing protein [Acerihabitans arboris]|uniref:substrate-binding domain-containing protein n=1 Tax=Acerihabitans arboris TaxID=2691583 RepID=UPI001FE859E7|nr:substrate-binding domain-containing protein [Acerihabitans arboris]
MPFLALGRSELAQQYAWFDFDNHAGSRLAVARLAALGHRRIAWLGSSNRQTYVKQRPRGYLDGMAQAALPVPQAYCLEAEANRRDGFLATQRLLALPSPPTAIITDCNMHGEGAANALQQAGLLDRISLIAYDGLPADSLVTRNVTPILQATRAEVGKQIAAMTCALIEGEPVDNLQVLWQPTLGEGDTARAPYGDE